MESKGLHVNMKKIKFMVSGVYLDVLQKSGNCPCPVCCKGVGKTPPSACNASYGSTTGVDVWKQFSAHWWQTSAQVDVEGYLGHMLCSGGGCDSAIASRCCVAWGKFRKLLPVLTSRHFSSKVRGNLYTSCVPSTMLHGSETWGLNILDLKRLHCNDCAMIQWICGTKDRVETSSVSLLQKLGIKDITAVLRSGRLRWYGHVQSGTSCIKSVTDLPLPCPRGKGRPRKTCQDW